MKEQQDPDDIIGSGADAANEAETPSSDAVDEPKRPWWRLNMPEALMFVGAAILVVILFVIPMPYVVDRPGPTFDVIGSSEGEPFIGISGTDPATGEDVALDPVRAGEDGVGQLRMVTVSETGGPASRLALVDLISAFFDPHARIIDYDEAYPTPVSEAEYQSVQRIQMTQSQSTAEIAALEHLGWKVPAKVTIAGAVEGSDAVGKVEPGDLVISITDASGAVHAVDSASTVFAIVRETAPGTTLALELQRAGNPVTAQIQTRAAEGEKGSKLGVYLKVDTTLPLDVSFNLDKVGGPSAGMMFSLGIIDRLTEGDLTGGKVIAGTGTMGYDGTVGPIGGIQQKLWSAQRDGATWFLAPARNCSEVVGHEPPGLRVVSVETLADAENAVRSMAAGTADSLPTCQAG